MSKEELKPIATHDMNKTRNLNDYHTKLKLKQIFIRLERK